MPEPTLPTQKFVDVKDIKDNVVFLKNGSMRQVIIVSGVNFDLKSEDEQNLILNTFQNFLNGLDFSVQFLIHSRKMNIDSYLLRVQKRREEEENELLKIQIEEYALFVKTFVEQNAIINKTFFVVVPYEPATLSVSSASSGGLFGLFGKPSKTERNANLQNNLEQLTHRVDQVITGLEMIGLRAAPLQDAELVELFYNFYNPALIEKKGLGIAQMPPPVKS